MQRMGHFHHVHPQFNHCLARKSRAGILCAGEPELAVAPHCLQRPVDVFTQVIIRAGCFKLHHHGLLKVQVRLAAV